MGSRRGNHRNLTVRAALVMPVVVGASVLPGGANCTDIGCGSAVTFDLGYDLCIPAPTSPTP